MTAHGPPPTTPAPAVSDRAVRIACRLRQSELVQRGRAVDATEAQAGKALRKRFWKDVSVRKVPEGLQVYLDDRPVRTPSKKILTIPATKAHLAAAIALEWDLLVTAQQALKHHLIPLTSLLSRAQDIEEDDRQGRDTLRQEVVDLVMRYLDTDTILCWAPEPSPDAADEGPGRGRKSLRQMQMESARPIISFLQAHVWPGVEIRPVTDSDSIVPDSQATVTKDIIRGWVTGLPAYELAGLERAVLAGKGLLTAARLVVEWSPHYRHLRDSVGQGQARFGAEAAAAATSTEVEWQTGIWGEVEDSHDVDKEDLRRQLGSVILLVSEDRLGTAEGRTRS